MASSTIDDVEAAPPDDGGTQGSFTVPGDALQTRETARQGNRIPALHHQPNTEHITNGEAVVAKPRAWLPLLIAAFVLLLLMAIVFGTGR